MPKTLKEALDAGYRISDQKYQRGYVSRKIPIGDCEVKIAGGSRAGDLYALVPCWKSTQYCVRVYLTDK